MDKGENMSKEEKFYTAEEKQQMFNTIAIKITGTEDGKRAIANLEQKKLTKMEKENICKIQNKIFEGTCPDQWVGNINVNKGVFEVQIKNNEDFFFRESISGVSCEEFKIIIILESPHTKEYIGDIGPAKGTTGTNIRTYLENILQRSFKWDEHTVYKFKLILMEAISYQCSLGIPPEYFRDKIFYECWESFGKEDFKNRLREIYKPETDKIINAATKGDLVPTIRLMVEAAIIQNQINYFNNFKDPKPELKYGSDGRFAHPVNWRKTNIKWSNEEEEFIRELVKIKDDKIIEFNFLLDVFNKYENTAIDIVKLNGTCFNLRLYYKNYLLSKVDFDKNELIFNLIDNDNDNIKNGYSNKSKEFLELLKNNNCFEEKNPQQFKLIKEIKTQDWHYVCAQLGNES